MRQPDLMPVPVNLFLPVEWLMIASSRTPCLGGVLGAECQDGHCESLVSAHRLF